MSTLGERVKEERKAKGWSQAELARRVTHAGYQITQGGIAQIERRGETEPKSIVQLATALGVSVHSARISAREIASRYLPILQDSANRIRMGAQQRLRAQGWVLWMCLG